MVGLLESSWRTTSGCSVDTTSTAVAMMAWCNCLALVEIKGVRWAARIATDVGKASQPEWKHLWIAIVVVVVVVIFNVYFRLP